MRADAAVSEGAAVTVVTFDTDIVRKPALYNVVIYSRSNTRPSVSAQLLSMCRPITVDVSESQKNPFGFTAAGALSSVAVEYLRF